MTWRLVITEAARADLREIRSFTKTRWGTAQESRYMGAIQSRLARLRQQAELGRSRPELGIGYRSLVVGAHLAIYRVEGRDVIVARVLHQAMDMKHHL